jgi:hypothetical protein
MEEMRKKGLIFGLMVEFLIITAIFTMSGLQPTQSIFHLSGQKSSFIMLPYKQYRPMKDTVYVLDSVFLVIDLKKQTAYLKRRNDTTISYKISSGTDKLHKGIKTPTGLFTVQNKTPKAISRQFNNAELLHWIGFKGNVGFHGLRTSGYYSYLGKKPSSHGCVRISRNDGEDLYDRVKRGTPILVIDSTPARILAFADPKSYNPEKDIILQNDNYIHRLIMEQRLENLFTGKALNNSNRVILDGKTILKPRGFEIGCSCKIPTIQKRSLVNIRTYKTHSDKTKVLVTLK